MLDPIENGTFDIEAKLAGCKYNKILRIAWRGLTITSPSGRCEIEA